MNDYSIPINAKKNRSVIWHKLHQQRFLFLFIVPGIIWFIIFCYVPMAGLIIAFKDYNLADGFLNSPWVGFKFFRQFFDSYYFPIIMRNTISISLIKLIFGFPIPIIFALLLNEVRSMAFKRTIQTVSYLPHFLSWVVALGIIGKLLSVDGGIVNQILMAFGIEPINFLIDSKYIWPLAYVSEVWKETGWNAIIYLAALTTIDISLYEASMVDGASKMQKIWHISLPGIRGAIIVILIMSVGNIFNSNFDQLYLLGSAPVIDSTEVIDTYIYRNNLQNFQYGLGTAVGLMKSVINVGLVLSVNSICRKLSDVSLF